MTTEHRYALELLRKTYGVSAGPDSALLLAILVSMRHARGRRPHRITAQYLANLIGKIESERIRLQLPQGPEAAEQIALRLAASEVQQLRQRPRGRPKKIRRDKLLRGRPRQWGQFELSLLAGEVTRELDNGASSVPDACKRLAETPWWSGWLAKRQWRNRTSPLRSSRCRDWDALRKAYATMDLRLYVIGKHAYRYSVAEDEPDIPPLSERRYGWLQMIFMLTG